MISWLDALEATLQHRPLRDIPAFPGRRNDRAAGVLVALTPDPEPTTVLIERAGHLRDHAGEVGFPGGKPEATDADLVATALREAHEELGVRPARVLGPLSAMPLFTSDYRLHPTVARLPAGPLRPDPGEVARVLHVPLGPWLDAPIPGIPWDWRGARIHSPILPLGPDGARRDDGPALVAYGGTAHVLLELLEVLAPLLGRPAPQVRGGWRWTRTGPVPILDAG